MDVSEKWGTDVDTAVDLALAELKAERDEVTVTVLEQPSRGFFGIGSKLALVRVERKKEEKPEPEKTSEKIESEEVVNNTENTFKKEAKKEKPVEKKVEPKPTSDKTEIKKKEPVKFVSPESEDMEDVNDSAAADFLEEVIEQMGLEISVNAKQNENDIFIYMEGKDAGTIIGKRGQTLDALQYLTSLVVNKDGEDYTRVVLDAENYRSKREKTLKKLAERLANKVVKTGRSVKLEPMNPYERKIIHSTLQSDSRVITRSEGQDPYRRVIIELK